MITHTFKAMNTRFHIWLDAQEPAAREAVAHAEAFVREVEATVSRFRPDSALSQVNREPGRWHRIPALMAAIVQEALAWAKRTDGLFDPTVLPALVAAGYDRSFDRLRAEEIRAVSRPSGHALAGRWPDVRLEGERLYLPPATALDLGGIAKEWTADKVAERLSEWGPCLVDAGGDVRVVGAPALWGFWPVGVAHPADPAQDVAVFALRDAAVATSSRARRRWRVNGHEAHHIIDPRTGRPADTPVLSAAVVAPTAVQAGVGSKIALLLGPTAAGRLAQVGALHAILVLEDGSWTQVPVQGRGETQEVSVSPASRR